MHVCIVSKPEGDSCMTPSSCRDLGWCLGVCADRVPQRPLLVSGSLDSMESESQGHFKALDRKRDFAFSWVCMSLFLTFCVSVVCGLFISLCSEKLSWPEVDFVACHTDDCSFW